MLMFSVSSPPNIELLLLYIVILYSIFFLPVFLSLFVCLIACHSLSLFVNCSITSEDLYRVLAAWHPSILYSICH